MAVTSGSNRCGRFPVFLTLRAALTINQSRVSEDLLKTRQLNNHCEFTGTLPGKRKRSEDEEPVVELPQAKIFKKSSIQSYFKPLVTSSSPAPNRSSVLHSEDSIQPTSTPPSSPLSDCLSPPTLSRKPIQRSKRRLSTKPRPLQIAKMSEISQLSGCPGDDLGLEDFSDSKDVDDTPKIQGLTQLGGRPRNATVSSIPMVSKAHPLEQTQLLLTPGGTVFKCQICGGRYNKASKDEVQIHDRAHTEFITLGSKGVNFDKVTIDVAQYWSSISPDAPVRTIRVNNASPAAVQSFAGRVLLQVNDELGHVNGSYVAINHNNNVIIALIQGQPVACIVTEGPAFAIPYRRHDNERPGGILMHDDKFGSKTDIHQVEICVERLWVHKDFRRSEFATRILTATRNHFGIARYQVCLSRPSADGYEFACSYFQGVFNDRFPNRDVKMLLNLDAVVPDP